MRTSPSPKQAAASPAAIDAQSRLRRFLPRNSFSADPERDFRAAHDLAVRLHDRWHGVNTEATDQEATLVEIETALMLRHRIERCALHHDQLGRLVVEAAQRPIELVPVLAVHEPQLLANRNTITRNNAMLSPPTRL